MKKSTVNVPFEVLLDTDGHGHSFVAGDLDVKSIYAPEPKAKRVLRARIKTKVEEMARAEKNHRRSMLGLKNGDVLLVEYRLGSWGYTFFGPGRKHGGTGGCVGMESYDEALDAARNHGSADNGIAWENA